MAKPNLGDKHICPNCETRYFDLGKTPPTCPKCSTVLDTGKGKAKAKEETPPEPVAEEPEVTSEEEALDDDLDVDLDVDEDLDDDEEDDDLMEDASDLGGDDDIAGVIDHADGKEEG